MMSTPPENIVVNSCQYTPVYLIQTPSVTQGTSYIITPNNIEEPKPVSDNLKNFYESSGNIEENNALNISNPKPRVLRKVENAPSVVTSQLKLANFLLPKQDDTNKQYVAINNIMLKPATNIVNTVPVVNMDRKIVKLKDIPRITKTPERALPKVKPKELIPTPTPSKHTSVQLLKLGETYHSLNNLSDDQMKIVNQALKIFSDPEKIPLEPTYDPVTNTKFIYKVVSPKDLKVVGKNKIVIKDKKEEVKKQISVVVNKRPKLHAEPESPTRTVTRSGRKVKCPKPIVPEESPQKARKKNGTFVSCFQCSAEFNGLYRLQRHYENHPTHIPAKIHSNLFHCLLAIIKSGSEENRANIFIQQLEQLIAKLKSLLPCVMKKVDGSEGKSCTINDDIGRLFGMNPGKYNLNVDALNCVKDAEGNCRHNPKSTSFTSEHNVPSQTLSKHNEETIHIEDDNDDCARINSVDKWPTVTKRMWKIKQKKSQVNLKKMRLASETEPLIELGIEDLVNFSKPNEQSAISIAQSSAMLENRAHSSTMLEKNKAHSSTMLENRAHSSTIFENGAHSSTMLEKRDLTRDDTIQNTINEQITSTSIEDQSKKSKNTYIQFHSAHFDIRSSPIKSSTIFRKFQINPEKIANNEVPIIRPLGLDEKKQPEIPEEINPSILPTTSDNTLNLPEILDIDLSKEAHITPNLNFDNAKDWILSTSSNEEKSHESFMKSNSLIEPSLLHVSDDCIEKTLAGTDINQSEHLEPNDNQLLSNQGQSVLQFLDALGNDCLTYPETEIRNNSVAFELDLFSFHNS